MTITFVNYNASKQVYFSAEYKHTLVNRNLSYLIEAGVSIIKGDYVNGLQSISEFVLKAETTASQLAHKELFVHS